MALPLSYLETHGPAADPVTRLGYGLGAISIAVCVLIAVLLLVAIFRRRGALPAQSLAPRSGRPLAWVYVGVGLTVVVLFGCVVWTLTTLDAVAMPAARPALTIHVTGHRWWWGVRYEAAPGQPESSAFDTANEIHIPVGRPVRVVVEAGDVIHSFWVPALAGKTDGIPGLANETWIEADRPGVYRGQCTEYCGPQHAHMGFEVVAETPAKFAAWRAAQLEPPMTPQGAGVRGERLFVQHCSACHAVRGSGAGGVLGPDLSHVGARRTIAAGTLPNDVPDLERWIADPQGVKPGTLMPRLPLAGDEIAAVATYLHGLQ